MNLLQKLNDLAGKTGEPELIDIDLMLDYTKVMYADLLEARARIGFNTSLTDEAEKFVEKNMNTEVPVAFNTLGHEAELTTTENYELKTDEPEISPTVEETEKIAEPIVSINTITTDEDIRKIIGINDKYLYINELFNGSDSSYEEVVNKLNSFRSYPEAISWLDEVHSENNWNDENDTVVSFYNIVNHYFASK